MENPIVFYEEPVVLPPLPCRAPAPIIPPLPAVLVLIGFLCVALALDSLHVWKAQAALAFAVVFAWLNGAWPNMRASLMMGIPLTAWLVAAGLLFKVAYVSYSVIGANNIRTPVHVIDVHFGWVAFGLFAVIASAYMGGVLHRLWIEK